MADFAFATYDVFTDTRFAGNPLAVVFDADGLSDLQMQAIAREFNLSETIFLSAPASPSHAAAARIFTPTKELPFAGHPTIGGAIAFAERNHAEQRPRDMILVLEEKIGPVRCGVELGDGPSFAEFSAPKISEPAGPDPAMDSAAQALGLAIADIGFGAHRPSLFSAGVPFAMIPVADLSALARAAPRGAFSALLGATEVFVYARAERDAPHAFRARMFAPEIGIGEDPATGSAAAAFAGVLARFEDLPDGWHTLPIMQGVEMGRPSLIGLEINIDGGVLTAARIAGKAVKVAEGRLSI
ncbi:MAG: PhzF family phenazine biosynthesis protein [Hyphomonadaceae bacterium]|nr:PhzF family phenazine biosynthesis protein [Hyphomonadaceae bacterium]